MSTKDEGVKISTYWGEPRMRTLWESLYDQDAVSQCRESDLELQSISILQANTYVLFKKMKNRHDKVARANNLLTERMDAINTEHIQMQSELAKLKTRCQKLEQELSIKNKKLKESEKQMKSIASILRGGGLLHTDETQAKAYSLLSEMFDENGDNVKSDELEVKEQKTPETKESLTKQKDEDHSEVDSLQKDVTLMQELFYIDENSMEDVICIMPKSPKCNKTSPHCVDLTTDNSTVTKDKAVEISVSPEIVEDLKSSPCLKTYRNPNKTKIVASTVLESDENSSTPKKVSGNPIVEKLSESIFETPRKRKSEEMEEESLSPQITSVCRRSFSGNGELKAHFSKDRMENKMSVDADMITSPSLLKDICSNSEVKNNIDEEKCKSTPKKEDTDSISTSVDLVNGKETGHWELKPDYKLQSPKRGQNRHSSSKTLKQTKLSLTKVPKVQDLSSFGEFAGGVLKTSTVDPSNVLPNENCKDKSLKPVTKKNGSDEDDDVIVESPNAVSSRRPYSYSGLRLAVSKDKNLSTVNKDTSNADETLFIPLTKNEANPRNEDNKDTIEELLLEMETPPQKKIEASSSKNNKVEDIVIIKEGKGDNSCKTSNNDRRKPEESRVSRQYRQVLGENSFDRLPGRVSKSPKYKYKPDREHRRDKKKSRLNLQEFLNKLCVSCSSLYEGLPLNMMDTDKVLRNCEKHRPNVNQSPAGIWDMNMSFGKK